MNIGLAFDLRDAYLAAGYGEEETAEFDRADTIDALAFALTKLGHTVDRIGNVHQLLARLQGEDSWDLVFNIAEGLRGMAREAQVPTLLELYDIPCTFSEPLQMALCLHKGLTKAVIRDARLPTPAYAVVEQLSDLDVLTLPFPLFAKPVAEGTGKGITAASRAENAAQLNNLCAELLQRYQQPVLVETYLCGREFTVGLLGTGPEAEVLGTLEICLRPGAEPDVYSYANKEWCEERVEYRLVSATRDEEVGKAEDIALAVWRVLGCRDAGRVDLRSDHLGQPHFLEVNPLPGLHPQHSDLPMLATAVGLSYTQLIERIVTSATARMGTSGARKRGAVLCA